VERRADSGWHAKWPLVARHVARVPPHCEQDQGFVPFHGDAMTNVQDGPTARAPRPAVAIAIEPEPSVTRNETEKRSRRFRRLKG
jgi:hypothetical protein